MKQVSEDRLEIIRLSHPNVRIEHRDGKEVVVIPRYDFETDTISETTMELVRKPKVRAGATFQPGDVLKHTETGSPFNVVEPPKTDEDDVKE